MRFAGKRVDLSFDMFNFLNIAAITSRDTAFNVTGINQTNWQRSLQVQPARFAKFYVQFDF